VGGRTINRAIQNEAKRNICFFLTKKDGESIYVSAYPPQKTNPNKTSEIRTVNKRAKQ
jgi:hypothetical protein